jgi:uncharacterized membrane protein YfcA
VFVPLQTIQLVAAAAALALGALVQGSIGFGMSLIAAPLLVLINPVLVPGPTIVVGLMLSALVAWRERQAIDLPALIWAFPGLLAGSVVAALLVSGTAAEHMGLILGGLILVAVGLSVAGLRVTPTPRNVFYASTLAGFMSTVASIPGPPLALIYQHSSGPRLRATLAPLFILCGAISLTTLSLVGRFGRFELALGLMIAPGILVGAAMSTYTARLLDRGSVRYGVLLIAALAGVAAIWRSLGS